MIRKILDRPVVRAAVVNVVAFGGLFTFAAVTAFGVLFAFEAVTQWLGLR